MQILFANQGGTAGIFIDSSLADVVYSVEDFFMPFQIYKLIFGGIMIYPNLEQARELQFKSIPISLTLDVSIETVTLYKKLRNISKNVFVLESCEDTQNFGRYSFLGFDPSLEVTAKDSTVTIKNDIAITQENTSPHAIIRTILEQYKGPKLEKLPPFTGGLVGYFSYDFAKYSIPKLKLDAHDDEGFNDVDLMLFTKVIAIDNVDKKIIIMNTIKTDNLETNYNKALLELDNIKNVLISGKPIVEEKGKLLSPLKETFSKSAFCAMVEKAKKYIVEGDIFQVVLSNRLSADYTGSLIDIYKKLRKKNPSPYMFYFSSDDVEIAGASPETLVKVVDSTVMTYPLAGTKPRGKTADEDIQLEKELLADEKERAEHNMLVDLGRNDVGRIAEFGSVKVQEYMKVLRFSTVMHIGSTVEGKVRDDKDALDVVDAILPAGTLSGAPKIRAMEIINELENEKRGIYGGAIGYLDFSGNIDTCIAIRLAFKKNNKIFVRSGAGIVMDSIPENEYEECINKAKSVVNVLED